MKAELIKIIFKSLVFAKSFQGKGKINQIAIQKILINIFIPIILSVF